MLSVDSLFDHLFFDRFDLTLKCFPVVLNPYDISCMGASFKTDQQFTLGGNSEI